MSFFRYPALVVALLLLSACDQNQLNSQSPNIDALKKEISELRKIINSVKSESDMNYILLKMRQEKFDDTIFDPSEGSGYGKLETVSGNFLVALREVTPYLDGVKVKLDFGNIQSATYNGFELKVEYSSRYPIYNDKDTVEEYNNKIATFKENLKTKSEKFTTVLRPGSWNITHMNLPGIKPDQFGHLKISMKTDQVSLRKSQ